MPWLMPREDVFFVELRRLAETGQAAAELLAATLGDLDPSGEQAVRIKALEHAGDELKDGLIGRLDRTFVTPLDREDLHDLAASLDGVINRVDRIARRLRLYRVTTVRPGAEELGGLIRKATLTITAAVRALGEKGSTETVLRLCDEIDEVEHEGDLATEEALSQLFAGGADALEVLKWKDLLEDLERATDKCKTVAGVLRRVAVKHA